MRKDWKYPKFSLPDRILGSPDYQWAKFMRLSDFPSTFEMKSYAEKLEDPARYPSELHDSDGKWTLVGIAAGRPNDYSIDITTHWNMDNLGLSDIVTK